MAAPTLEDARRHLSISSTAQDAELMEYLATAQSLIERRTGAFAPTSRTHTVRTNGSALLLSHRPVVSVESVTDAAGVSVDTSGAAIDATAGIVHLSLTPGVYTVTYTAGLTDVPDALKMAALITLRHLWNTKRGNTRRAADDDTMQNGTGAGYALPWMAVEMCAPFDLVQGVG